MMFGGLLTRQAGGDPRAWVEPEHLLAKLDPFAVADAKGRHREGPALLAQATRWNTPENRGESPPVRCADSGSTIVGWIRLDNRAGLCRELALDDRYEVTDAAIVLAAYARWGRDAAPQLEGEFSFAIYDPASRAMWCVRDVVGTRPFFYAVTADWFAFGSTAALFSAIRHFEASPNEVWIGRYLLGYSHSHTYTALEGVFRLPPAHDLLITPEKIPEPRRYYAFEDPQPGIGKPDDRWVERYRNAMDRAVGQSLRSSYPVAAELSGGIDSSAIVASAALQTAPGEALHTIGLSMFEEDDHAQRLIARHCGLEDHVVLSPDLHAWATTTAGRAQAMLGFPIEHANAGIHAPVYEVCARIGARTLLSGFGGDEIVSSGGREVCGETLRAGHVSAYWQAIGATAGQRIRGSMRTLRESWRQSGNRQPVEAAFMQDLDATPFSREYRHNYNLDAFQHSRVKRLAGDTPNSTILARAFRANIAGRLESCSAIAASYGVEYRWPLLNRELIELFLASPSIERHYGGIGRYLHRRANRERLPEWVVFHAKSMGPVRTELSHHDKESFVKSFDLLPDRLVSILDREKYRELGESLEHGSRANAGFDRALAFRRELVSRLGTVSDWLSAFDS